MSIGFSFTGAAGNLEAFLVRCRKLARDRDYGVQIGKNGLRFLLCPLGGDLYVRWKDSGNRWLGHLAEGECQSTPAGPGFHKAACELLDALELRRLAVKDETDYFAHRDFDRMREEHFYPWLNNLIHTCLDRMDPQSYELVCLCWDLNQYRPEGVPGTVVTPMGRFDLGRLAHQADEGGIRDIAGRFFLWNGPERDACFFRNLAVNALWENCAFVPSSRSEEDERTNGGILDSLEQAARLDPALPLPRAAYREVCALAERTPALPEGPELDFDYPPGFRKGLVTYAFGALSITLPGSYRWDWEEYENGGGNNRCWDSSAEYPVIWRVSAFRRRAGQAEFTSDFQDPSKVTLREFPNGSARLRWLELDDGDGPYCRPSARCPAAPPSMSSPSPASGRKTGKRSPDCWSGCPCPRRGSQKGKIDRQSGDNKGSTAQYRLRRFTTSFTPEIRCSNLKSTKDSCVFAPFSDAKSAATRSCRIVRCCLKFIKDLWKTNPDKSLHIPPFPADTKSRQRNQYRRRVK